MSRSAIDRATDTVAELATDGCGPAAVHHPLGFYCLPVVRDGGYGVCLHVWNGRADAVDPPPHSHSWELTSHVLDGVVINRLMDVTDDPADPTDRVYHVDSAGDRDRVRPTSRLVRRALREEHRTRPGGVYRLPAGSFHTTAIPTDDGAITVVVGSTDVAARDMVLGPLDGWSHDTIRRRCDAAQTAALARVVLDRLHRAVEHP